MIIGIDASRANKKEKTGTEWYSYHVIEELKKLDTEGVQFVLYSKEKLEGDLAELPKTWKSKVLRWPPGKLWTQFRFSWEMLWHKPDILFVPAHTIPLIHPARNASRSEAGRPKKTITTLHDIGFLKYPELYSKLEIAYHRFSARFALAHAAHIITVSEFSKKEMIDIYGSDPKKISVVYNGYDDTRYRILPEERVKGVLEKYKIKKPYLLFVGRLEEKKNVLGIVKALAILKKSSELKPYTPQLVLVGNRGYGYEKIKAEIEKNNLGDSVLELGWIDKDELPALHNGASVFVFPSFYEGFGIPVIEAMASGTPVVASSAASLPEVVGDAGVIIDPEKPEQIAEAVEKILDNEDFRKDLIEKGFVRAKEFSWEKCAKETFDIIKNI